MQRARIAGSLSSASSSTPLYSEPTGLIRSWHSLEQSRLAKSTACISRPFNAGAAPASSFIQSGYSAGSRQVNSPLYRPDQKRVVSGKGVYVRVNIGGRRNIKKKKK